MTVSKSGGSGAGGSGAGTGHPVPHDPHTHPPDPLIGHSNTHLTSLTTSAPAITSLTGTSVVQQEPSSSLTASDGVVADDTADNEREGVDSESGEAVFPVAELNRLDDMINRPRWVIPVLPRGELEVLLDSAIALTRKHADHLCEPCQRFYREGLSTSFTKILTDDAVSGWKMEIHVSTPASMPTLLTHVPLWWE